ncbi:hypothetical protein C8F04DRAFT_191906 [Mycena alexandri]|uniref:Uncharacterized protein n=1 Tax=Mycena alexandri TaxID=1745969 RepID=A0AAD6S8J0_9AGAR|nr:hypothetical protein C8F04DRAFT_191906 [Mycena alexandri]
MPLPSTRTRIVSSDVTPTTTYSNSSRAEYRLPGRESVSPTIASTRPEYTTRSSCNVHSDGMYPYFVLACLCKRGIIHLYGRRQEVFGVERVRMCGGTRRVRAAYPRPSLNPFLRSALRLRAEFGCAPMTRFPSLSSPFSLPRARRARFYLFPRPSARSYARLRKWVDEAYGDAMYFSIRVHGDEAGDGDGDGDRGWRALASFPGLVLHAPRKRPRASMYAYARRRCRYRWRPGDVFPSGIGCQWGSPRARSILMRGSVIIDVSAKGSMRLTGVLGSFSVRLHGWRWIWIWIWRVAGAGAERNGAQGRPFFRTCACPSFSVLPLKRVACLRKHSVGFGVEVYSSFLILRRRWRGGRTGREMAMHGGRGGGCARGRVDTVRMCGRRSREAGDAGARGDDGAPLDARYTHRRLTPAQAPKPS